VSKLSLALAPDVYKAQSRMITLCLVWLNGGHDRVEGGGGGWVEEYDSILT